MCVRVEFFVCEMMVEQAGGAFEKEEKFLLPSISCESHLDKCNWKQNGDRS